MPWLRALTVALVACAAAAADDWPRWLGPNGDGVSKEKVAAWKGKLTVRWRKDVAEGHSSPVVAGGRVYLHTRVDGQNKEALNAFDAATGNTLWTKTYDRTPYKGLFGAGPRGTPEVADGRVYTHGITGILACFEAADGKPLWQVDTLKEFKGKIPGFGSSASPVLDGKLLLLNVGAKGAGVVAFDKDSGKAVWQKLDDGASYASPVVFGEGKNRQTVFLTQEGLVSLRPEDGVLLWRFPFKDKLMESSTTPVRAGDLIVGSSITQGGVALRLEEKGGKTEATQVWRKPELNCYFATPVSVGDDLYLVTGTKPPAASMKSTLRCVDAKTGKEYWKREGVGKYHACLLRTGDNKLLLLEESGQLVLIEPDRKEYRELARSPICGQTWAHPALANGHLYIRDNKELVCVQMP